MVLVQDAADLPGCGALRDDVRVSTSELEMIHSFVRCVQELDPDILVGYEVQMSSWGYLIERAAKLDINLAPLISRLPDNPAESKMDTESDWCVLSRLCGRGTKPLWGGEKCIYTGHDIFRFSKGHFWTFTVCLTSF